MFKLSIDPEEIARANAGTRGKVVALNPCTIELEAGIALTLGGDPGADIHVGQTVCFVEPYLN